MINAVLERCAGIDIGKKFLVACVMAGPADGEPKTELRRFGTTVPELERLRSWLQAEGCTHAAMESTGTYWKPVFNILEGTLIVILANAQQVKARKGHKTDPKDSAWLAHLLRHAMIRPSFIPPREIRELRELTRRRRQLSQAGTAERNRLQKVLEEANVKIGSVLSDVFGMTGQAILEAIPAIKEASAAAVLAEIGFSMTPFTSSAQLVSWAGLCPGNNRSADRNLGTRCNKGNQWLRTTLAECAWAASMQNGSIFQARFQRLAPRIGRRAAIVAVAHAMLIAVYHVLQTGQPYSKGAARIAPNQKHRLIRHHFRCLRRLGVNPIAESIIAADSA